MGQDGQSILSSPCLAQSFRPTGFPLFQTFHDGSDFVPFSRTPAPAAVSELLRGEDFISAAEFEESYQIQMPREGSPDPEVCTLFFSLFPFLQGESLIGIDVPGLFASKGVRLRPTAIQSSAHCPL